MREVSFVGECDIDLSSAFNSPLNGKCAYLCCNLVNNPEDDNRKQLNLVKG